MKLLPSLLCILWARFLLAEILLESKDVGVHKCEFQGRLGEESVRLYVFLTSCVRPLAEPPRAALAVHVRTAAEGAPANPAVAASAPIPAGAAAAAVAPAGRSDAPAGARRALAAGTEEQAAPNRLGAAPNVFLSGFAFMLPLDPDTAVTATQLQQPLSTLMWAARRPAGEYLLPTTSPTGSGDGGSYSRSSRSSGSNGGNAVGSTSSFGGDDGSDGSGGNGGASPGQEGGSSDGAVPGVAAGAPSRSHRWDLLQWEEAPAPPPDTFLGAVRQAARQLVNGTADVISIRCDRLFRSSQQYGIHLSYRDPLHWHVNPSLRREPGRLGLRLSLDPAELREIFAADSNAAATPPAFEITAAGFEGTCLYTPRRGKRQPPLATFGNGADVGTFLPVCGWLAPDRVAYDKLLYDFWRRLQQAGAVLPPRMRRRKRRRRPPPPPPPPPPVTSLAPPTYMVISPYFNLTPYDFATLLLHHMNYHAALGVHRYLVYLEEGELHLASDPRLAPLAAAGRLQLVRWRELPAFRAPGLSDRHPYAMQILTYNHALLSLWHEAAVVAVADLDEYLMTQQPMKLEQVLFSCSPHGRYPPAALWVPRRSVLCTSCFSAIVADQPDTRAALTIPRRAKRPDAEPLRVLSNRHAKNASLAAAAATLERPLWMHAAAASAAATAVVQQHPLEHYRHWREGWHHKSLMYSHLVSYVGVHLSYSATPSRRPHTVARLGCAVWSHVETQLGPRRAEEAAGAAAAAEVRERVGEGEAGATTVGGLVTGLGVGVGQFEEEDVAGAGAVEGGPGGADGAEGVATEQEEAEDGQDAEAGQEAEDGNEVEEEGEDTGEGSESSASGAEQEAAARGLVIPVEHRYYWALGAHLGRQVPWAQYWGQRVEGVPAWNDSSPSGGPL